MFLFSNPCLLRVFYCVFCKKWLYVAALSVKYLAAVVGSLAMAEYLSGAMFLFGSARRAASGFQARADLKLLVYGLGASRRAWVLLNQFQLDSLSFVAVEQDRPQPVRQSASHRPPDGKSCEQREAEAREWALHHGVCTVESTIAAVEASEPSETIFRNRGYIYAAQLLTPYGTAIIEQFERQELYFRVRTQVNAMPVHYETKRRLLVSIGHRLGVYQAQLKKVRR